MLKKLRIGLSIIVMILAVYVLITSHFNIMPYMMSFLGAMILVTGISEFREKRKVTGSLSIFAAGFILFVIICSSFE